MMEPRVPAEILELLAALREGAISEAEMAQLSQLIAADASARHYYLEYMSLWAELRLRFPAAPRLDQEREEDAPAASDSSDAMIMPALRDVDILPEEAEAPVQLATWAPARSETAARRRPRWLLAAAVMLPLLAGALAYFAVQRPAHSGATLTAAFNVRWDESIAPPLVGHEISRENLFLKSGIVNLALANGVVVVVEGPARFRVASPLDARLELGKLAAHVPPAGHGFTVQAPQCRVIDLGTEFGMAVDSAGRSDLQVFRGQVSLRSDRGGAEKVAEGSTRTVDTVGRITEGVAPAAGFIRPAQVEAWVKAADASPLDRWQAYSDRLRRDPDLIAYYIFDNAHAAPDRLLNLSPLGPDLDGVLGGGDADSKPSWSTGRWPEKGSLEFNAGTTQHVSVPASPELDFRASNGRPRPFSIAAWVEIGPQNDSGIVSRGRWFAEQYSLDAGMPFFRSWMRDEAGTPRSGFEVRSDADLPTAWHHVAMIHDATAGRLAMYVDGRLAAEHEAPPSLIPTSGELSIGSRVDALGAYAVTFDGRIDEVAIFRRSLSPAEVSEMYAEGRPQ